MGLAGVFNAFDREAVGVRVSAAHDFRVERGLFADDAVLPDELGCDGRTGLPPVPTWASQTQTEPEPECVDEAPAEQGELALAENETVTELREVEWEMSEEANGVREGQLPGEVELLTWSQIELRQYVRENDILVPMTGGKTKISERRSRQTFAGSAKAHVQP